MEASSSLEFKWARMSVNRQREPTRPTTRLASREILITVDSPTPVQAPLALFFTHMPQTPGTSPHRLLLDVTPSADRLSLLEIMLFLVDGRSCPPAESVSQYPRLMKKKREDQARSGKSLLTNVACGLFQYRPCIETFTDPPAIVRRHAPSPQITRPAQGSHDAQTAKRHARDSPSHVWAPSFDHDVTIDSIGPSA